MRPHPRDLINETSSSTSKSAIRMLVEAEKVGCALVFSLSLSPSLFLHVSLQAGPPALNAHTITRARTHLEVDVAGPPVLRAVPRDRARGRVAVHAVLAAAGLGLAGDDHVSGGAIRDGMVGDVAVSDDRRPRQ